MGIRIHFDTEAIAIPGAVCRVLDRAGEAELKVLFALCAHRSLCEIFGDEGTADTLAELSGCTPDEVQAAIGFWRGVGVMDMGKAGKAKASRKVSPVSEPAAEPAAVVETPAKAETEDKPRGPKPAPKNELPRYTTEELATLLEQRKDAADCIDECQRIWGKMFNTHEVNILLGLVDYLGLDWEYVLILLAYCLKVQEARGVRRSLRYVETVAFDFYDEGVCDVAALNEKIRQSEQMAETESQLRTLFGMGSRSLTPTEKKYFSTWLYEYKYGMDIIRRAYEITVDSKGEFKIKYMNSILANWHSDGRRTLEDVDRAEAAFRAANETSRSSGVKAGRHHPTDSPSSFDVDDFFRDAVRRNFGDDFDPRAQ